ncbi:flagellar biosynthetic protein FliO [Aureimonas leprariae]|uniref:flagellar biosynthetic protein FliO n=1 Tax=Plantimonas leprariae TaxID=2615207 RepID=UPI00192A67DE|nr:flagellar biosynthetic protein FliO [Aureimonas leprariae]
MPSGLSQSLETNFGPLATYAVVTAVFFALLLLVVFLNRRMKRGGAIGAGRSRGPRLAVLDVAAVDQRRKLVLLRRDDVEHLVLIGGQNDLVVESGILRAPVSAHNGAEERVPAARVEPVATQPPPVERPVPHPAVIAPEPRRQPMPAEAGKQAPSPLRRTLPRREPEQVVQPARSAPAEAEARIEPQRAPARSERPVAPVQPGPLLEPAIVADPAPAVAAQAKPPAVEPPRPQPVSIRAAPPPTRSAAPPKPSALAEEPQRRDANPEVPAFLKRSEPVAVPAPQAHEASMPAIARDHAERVNEAPEVESIPPISLGRTAAEIDAAHPAMFEPPLVGPAEPVRLVPERAPSATPVLARLDPTTTEAAPAAAAELRPAPSGASEEAERRPLSVRSFASAIQSRRSLPEAGRPERVAPAAPPARQPQQLVPATDDPSLDDKLSRELDSDLGSLDWNPPRQGGPDAPRPQAPAVASDGDKPERRLTLEEEMERLLGDFDFNATRR